MKKIILSIAGLVIIGMIASPAIAATQWNFGGRLAFRTFWTERDGGKYKIADLEGGGASVSNDGLLDWSNQSNTEIDLYARADRMKGYIELGWDYDNNKVWTREYWVDYKFGDKFSITIGQQHQLFSQLNNQVWGGDWDSNGIGTNFAPPSPKITLNYDNFHFAMSKPYNGRAEFGGYFGYVPFGAKDVDTLLPQLQASYMYFADTWKVHLGAGYQNLKLKDIQGLNNKDKTINSWIITADADVDFGPLYIQVAAGVGQNWSDAGWNDEAGAITTSMFSDNYFNQNMGVNIYNGKLKNTTSTMASISVGYRLTESLRFEAGAGYRHDDNDAFYDSNNNMNFYLQAAYDVAPGFVITPEIGYIDFGDHVGMKGDKSTSRDNGYLWYAGAQWALYF